MRYATLFPLPPGQRDFPHRRMESGIDVTQISIGQRNAKTAIIFFYMSHAAHLGNGHDDRVAQHPRKHHLHGCGIMPPGNTGKHLTATQPTVAKRSISHHRNISLPAPRDKVVFYTTVMQIIKHLVCRAPATARQGNHLLHVGHIEVAHAPIPYFPFTLQFGHGANRLGKRITPCPVQQVKVESVPSRLRLRSQACLVPS